MIFLQNAKQSISQNKRNHVVKNHQISNHHMETRNSIKDHKQQEKVGCFCFKSSRNSNKGAAKIDDSKFTIENDDSLKEQALRLSRQIAEKSFKHLKLTSLSSKNLASHNEGTSSTTKQTPSFKTNPQKFPQTTKTQQKPAPAKQSKPPVQQKDEFNMSRLTFSAINRSYQKASSNSYNNINNTAVSNNNVNNSISMELDSNILGSIVSQSRNDADRRSKVQGSFLKGTEESLSSISSLSRWTANTKAGLNSSQSSTINSTNSHKKRVKVLRTAPSIEPIKEENDEEAQPIRYKFIRVKAKDFKVQTGEKTRDSSNNLEVKKVITEEKIYSKQEDEGEQQQGEEMVKYDYSSIVIDFFNMDPQTIESRLERERYEQGPIEQVRFHEEQNRIVPSQQLPHCFPPSRQASFTSQTSYNPTPSITSHLSAQSNLLSVSTNNFSEFSCSFDSIARRQIKWGYRCEGFEGLSCINEHEESEGEGRNQSEVEEYDRERGGYV